MRFTDVTSITGEKSFKCFMCGERKERGGEWHGHTGTLNICSDRRCLSYVIQLLRDTVEDDAETDGYMQDLISEVIREGGVA